jgi:putative ABC transport system ATP-binding protein
MKPIITVEGLKKTYPGQVPTYALKGVSFEIYKKEFVAIMGKSGSGKSTLLHQLGLLDTPSEGRLTIDGADILSLDEADKSLFRLQNLGYVFQEYALIHEMSSLDNVLLPAFALNGSRQKYRDKAMEILVRVGLGHRAGHFPSELSGGEQQRVAIARSLINDPKILFADEPTANLDSASSRQILELFQKLNCELGQTIVMVTHEPDDQAFVDRTFWFKDGLMENIVDRNQSQPARCP